MRKLLESPRAVAGLTIENIDTDTRLFESEGGHFHLKLVEPGQQTRPGTQAFIADAYRRAFAAELKEFYPSLVALHDTGNGLEGAAGARYAQGQHLFLEQYLDRPIERLISREAGTPAAREGIVELGNLSVARPALTYPFISMIGGWLETYGVEWIVFSLTRTLQRLFARAGVELVDLGPAEPARLAPSTNHWGSYYAHQPRVMAARLTRGLVSFHQRHGDFNAPRAPQKAQRQAQACRA